MNQWQMGQCKDQTVSYDSSLYKKGTETMNNKKDEDG